MQISLVLSRGMLAKSVSPSKLPIDNAGSCSQISSAKWKTLTVYSFLVKTKKFTRLHVGICKADKDDLNGGEPTTCLCNFYSPDIVSGIVPTGFIDLHISIDTMFESTSF